MGWMEIKLLLYSHSVYHAEKEKGRKSTSMRKIQREEILWIIVVMTFILAVFFYGIGRVYGFSLFPDEFGYWASAAKAAGYDWSEISSLGSYYSFG